MGSHEWLAGHAAARALKESGVPWVAGVAGESFLPLSDGLRREGLEFVSVAHESGATFLASAHARATGKAAVVAVTRGPGTSNAVIGIHGASQASAPVVLIVGQIESRYRGRRAFQEMEVTQVFGTVAKATHEVTSPEQVVPALLAAIRKAEMGRPGPVVVSVPADHFFGPVAEAGPVNVLPAPAAGGPLGPGAVHEIADAIERSRRGVIIAGSPFSGGEAAEALGEFALRTGLGVVGGHAFPDALASDHPHWLGCNTVRGP